MAKTPKSKASTTKAAATTGKTKRAVIKDLPTTKKTGQKVVGGSGRLFRCL